MDAVGGVRVGETGPAVVVIPAPVSPQGVRWIVEDGRVAVVDALLLPAAATKQRILFTLGDRANCLSHISLHMI